MARILFVLAMFLLVVSEDLHACDACGCSIQGTGLGLLTLYRQNYIGVQFQYNPFSSRLEHAQGATDHFYAWELSLRFQVFQRWYLQVNQPYRIIDRNHPSGDATRSGPGDSRLMGSYIISNNIPLIERFLLYAEAGMGVKAPTGPYDSDIQEKYDLPDNFNPGNGSWAGILSSHLVLSHGQTGLTVSGNYQFNGKARHGYRFGNQWSGQAMVYHHLFSEKQLLLTPFTGISSETISQDQRDDGIYAAGTGGSGWFAVFGANVKLKDWVVSGAFSLPFSQEYSHGEVEAKSRLTAQVSYIF